MPIPGIYIQGTTVRVATVEFQYLKNPFRIQK